MKTTIRCKAPLRLGLAGGGTDVSPYSDQFGGAILNATITLFTYTTIELLDEPKIIFEAIERGEYFECDLTPEIPATGDLLLHKGVYNRVIKQFNGGQPLAVKISTHSDAPAGSGLGTSSTLMVSMLRAFQEILNLPFGEYELAHMAYEIERVDLAMAGGKQDQYAAAFGGVNFMEFSESDKVIVNPLRIKQRHIHELAYNLMLYYTGTSRLSAEIIKNQVSNVQKGEGKSIDAMHKLKEQAVMMKEALLKGQVSEIGRILDYGWQQKKQMSGSISNPLIDDIYESALKLGAIGGKVSGAGGGGFMMLYCDGLKRFAIKEGLEKFGGKFVDFQFYDHGADAWRIG